MLCIFSLSLSTFSPLYSPSSSLYYASVLFCRAIRESFSFGLVFACRITRPAFHFFLNSNRSVVKHKGIFLSRLCPLSPPAFSSVTPNPVILYPLSSSYLVSVI